MPGGLPPEYRCFPDELIFTLAVVTFTGPSDPPAATAGCTSMLVVVGLMESNVVGGGGGRGVSGVPNDVCWQCERQQRPAGAKRDGHQVATGGGNTAFLPTGKK